MAGGRIRSQSENVLQIANGKNSSTANSRWAALYCKFRLWETSVESFADTTVILSCHLPPSSPPNKENALAQNYSIYNALSRFKELTY